MNDRGQFDWIFSLNYLNLFFKAFAIIFSLMLCGFGLIVYQQTKVLSKTLTTKAGKLLITISLMQFLLMIIILLVAIFLI